MKLIVSPVSEDRKERQDTRCKERGSGGGRRCRGGGERLKIGRKRKGERKKKGEEGIWRIRLDL